MELFNSRPEYDVLHVALHGKYDAQGNQEGIVLLKKSPAGGAVAQYLTPTMLEGGSLPHGPFVFLNACQVGADETVLGDYAGFASTLLRIGAAGVVAPLWNVKDDVAHTVARTFYAATLARRGRGAGVRSRGDARACGRRTPKRAPRPRTPSCTPRSSPTRSSATRACGWPGHRRTDDLS